jgi:hypothetical protein
LTLDTDRRRRWTFGFRAGNLWFWQIARPDGQIETSSESFTTLADCVLDAKAHGYVAWPLLENRRSTEGDDAISQDSFRPGSD